MARTTLPAPVQARVREAWARRRALILANKPGYSEAFTIEAEQYALLREAILAAIDRLADADSTRRSLAAGYLRDASLSLAEVAYLLGYDEQPSFFRAFRRWHGTTPGAWRRQAP